MFQHTNLLVFRSIFFVVFFSGVGKVFITISAEVLAPTAKGEEISYGHLSFFCFRVPRPITHLLLLCAKLKSLHSRHGQYG